jgi:hypothetical protein
MQSFCFLEGFTPALKGLECRVISGLQSFPRQVYPSKYRDQMALRFNWKVLSTDAAPKSIMRFGTMIYKDTVKDKLLSAKF